MKRLSVSETGEVRVWIAGLGLLVGLLMIAWLLFVVTSNGLAAFWPSRIVELELSEAATTLGGQKVVAGARISRRPIDPQNLSPEQLVSDNPLDRREDYMFVGNREVYGQSYVYIPAGSIQRYQYPRGIIHAERQRYGDAIFYPLGIALANGDIVPVESPGFSELLRSLVNEARQRRGRIDRLERVEIGRLNNRIEGIRAELRRSQRSGPEESVPSAATGALADIESRIALLESEYEPLAEEAARLRAMQTQHMLTARLAGGETVSLSIGDIHSYFYANDIGLLERLGIMAQSIWSYLSGFPREANTEGGVFPAIFGTFVMTLLMSIAVMPFGVLAAVYLHEYSRQGLFVRTVRIAVNNLAGVPSIVFGIFGLGFFVHVVGGTIDQLFFLQNLPDPTFKTPGILWASLTLALLTLPVVIVTTEEALAAIPVGIREGSYACGAGKWRTIRGLVLPAASPGILTAMVLAMARGAGEVAPLILTGVVALAPNLPLSTQFPFVHLERQFMHLGFHIYDLGFQSPDSEAARPMVFATTLILILIVVILNLTAIIARDRLRRRHMNETF